MPTVDYGFCYPEAFQQTQAGLDATHQCMQDLGATRVRILVPWNQTQKSAGVWFWDDVRRAVNSARAHGLKPLLVGAPFGLGRPSQSTPTDFGNWWAAVVTEFKGDTNEWEIWNEQNSLAFYIGSVNPAEYTTYLRAAYTKIKSVQLASTVLLGGLAPQGDGGYIPFLGKLSMDPVDFLKGVYDAGGKPYFDAVANHPYSITTGFTPEAPSTTQHYIARDVDLYAMMVANGDGAKKIWWTEMGFPYSVVGENQAPYLATQLEIYKTRSYVGPVFFYACHDLTADASQSESSFGAFKFDYTPRPPTVAFYKAINPAGAKTGAGTRPVGVLATGTGQVTVKNAISVIATGTAQVGRNAGGDRPVGVVITGTGSIVQQKSFYYLFTGTGSTKPTLLFTEFGQGYVVSGGVANAPSAPIAGSFFSGGIYNEECVSSNHRAQFRQTNYPFGDRADIAIVRASADGKYFVGAMIHWGGANSVQIFTCINGGTAQQASSSQSMGPTDVLTLEADGNTYSVSINGGAVICSWVDNTGIFPQPNNKRIGFGFQHLNSGGVPYSAPGTSEWAGGDLRPAVPTPTVGGALGIGVAATGAGTVGTRAGGVTPIGVAITGVGTVQTVVPGSGARSVAVAAAGAASVGKVAQGDITAMFIAAGAAAVGALAGGDRAIGVVITGTAVVTTPGQGSGDRAIAVSATGAGVVGKSSSGDRAVAIAAAGAGAAGALGVGARAVAIAAAGAGNVGKTAGGDRAVGVTITGAGSVAAVITPPTLQTTGSNQGAQGFNTVISATVPMTAGSAANRYALVAVDWRHGGQAYAAQTTAATYNGVAMTKLYGVGHSTDCSFEIWGIANPPAGTVNVAVSCSNPSNTGREVSVCAAVFNGVSSVSGTLAANAGTGTAMSVSVAPVTGDLAIGCFGMNTSGVGSAGSGATLVKTVNSSSFTSCTIISAPSSITSLLATSSVSGGWVGESIRLVGV